MLAEIEALPAAQRPCYGTVRGLYNGAFVRVGDGDQRLTAYEIDRLRENPGQPRWDEEPVGISHPVRGGTAQRRRLSSSNFFRS